jgi:hypothetical protein
MRRWFGSPWRRGVLALASVAALAGWASAALATVHGLSGSLRFQFADGLPTPALAALAALTALTGAYALRKGRRSA